jgi:predicted nuclease of predicted toxin-antitoxin system
MTFVLPHNNEALFEWSDSQIWLYARENNLTVVTKDIDFSNRIILSKPPPRVIHIKVGNMRLSSFRQFMIDNWERIEQVSKSNKLVNVYLDKITTGID